MGQDVSLLIDIATGQRWLLKHAMKEFEFVGLRDGFPLSTPVDDLRYTVKPAAEARKILRVPCKAYLIVGSAPITKMGSNLTVKATGRAWIATDGPGVAEYVAARKAMAAAGLDRSIGGGGPLKSTGAAFLQDTALLMQQEVRVITGGAAQAIEALGPNASFTWRDEVIAVSIASLPDERFSIPPDYSRAGVQQIRPGDGIVPPTLPQDVNPSYSGDGYREKIQGVVVLQCVVEADASITGVRVLKPLWPSLDEQAIKALKSWRFTPATKNGKPVPVLMIVEMSFRLR